MSKGDSAWRKPTLVKRPVAGSTEGKPTEVLVFQTGGIANLRGPNTRIVEFGTDGADALRGRGTGPA